MAQPLIDYAGAAREGFEFGQRQRLQREGEQRQSRLSELASLAYGAQGPERQAAIGQAYGVDPQFAAQLSGQLGKDEEASRARLLATARLIKAAPPEQKEAIFQRVRPALSNDLPNLPLNYNEQVGQGIDAYISAYGDGKAEEGFTLSPGSARYDASGRQIVSQPFAPVRPDFVLSPDGTQWLPKPTGLPAPAPAATGGSFGIAETDNYVRNILGRAGPVDPNATPEQQAEQLLPFLIQQESGGDPNAVSPKGAQGLTQVLPTTGRDPGFGVTPLRDQSPEENVRFGREYLTAMLRRYPGRPDLALAAYNAGPGVADRFAQPQASAAGGAAIPIPGATPRPGPEETFSNPTPVTDPQTGRTVLVQFGNRGGRRIVSDYAPPDTTKAGGAPTEGERTAATLLKRLEFSEKQLEQATKERPSSASPSVLAETARVLPFVGGAAARTLNSSERQRVESAQLDILDAALTLGTGAAYTREQLEGYRSSYFPEIGDSDDNIRDKAARLKNIIDAAKIKAGRAAPAAGGGGQAAPAAPQRARNPQTGQVIELRNGQWVPVDG